MNNKITILGAGESGIGAAILAKKHLYNVFVSDFNEIIKPYKEQLIKYNINFEENKHTIEKITNANLIIKSPGIDPNAEIFKEINTKKIPIISEIEFAARFTNAKMICITGSNGKTTTTLLTYEILKNAGYNVGLGGNVGQSFAKQVAINDYDYYVLEISSFQLENMVNFKPDTAVLLNITPDHLDRYNNDILNYINTKLKITKNQTQNNTLIYNHDDPNIKKHSKNILAKKIPFSIKIELEQGAFLKNNKITIKNNNKTFEMPTADIKIKGNHNIYNSLAAAAVAMCNNISNPIIRKTLKNFSGVEHRLEHFLTLREINFINDSKATNVNSVWYALETINTPIILILGGIDKGNDYSIILNLVKQKVKAIIALGTDNQKIIEYFKQTVPIIESSEMNDAVLKAYKIADTNETVLLSPACASFDLFKNYIDRGQKFKNAVRNL